MSEYIGRNHIRDIGLEVSNTLGFRNLEGALHQDDGVYLLCENGINYSFVPKLETERSEKSREYLGRCFKEGTKFNESAPLFGLLRVFKDPNINSLLIVFSASLN